MSVANKNKTGQLSFDVARIAAICLVALQHLFAATLGSGISFNRLERRPGGRCYLLRAKRVSKSAVKRPEQQGVGRTKGETNFSPVLDITGNHLRCQCDHTLQARIG